MVWIVNEVAIERSEGCNRRSWSLWARDLVEARGEGGKSAASLLARQKYDLSF